MLSQMKVIIKYIIELDIEYLETFRGYHGDNVLKITLRDTESRDKIGAFLDNMGLIHKDDYDISQRYGGAYNIFVGIENDEVFKLKGS